MKLIQVVSPTTDDDIKAELIVFRGDFNIFKVRIHAKLRSKNVWTIVGDEKRTDDYAAEFDPMEGKAFDLLVNSLDNLSFVSHVLTSAEV
ncbi:hypothetical protein H310_14756 [Aphanomyces invadans]|uniref:Uncharacterized protein n=1 Tax=Aphanomyces invadans TaxID=157072 RepID=A0A024TA26_9STRA|nr:hypothetical protein H310_14756 [Aphanomyces invadans]ETV90456.1 hypothetical protein H310_14756 [Aphanomyces invadans]|eukprot:XP_008880905.1 hypothetical protein H310_14756 [Aphanomyces invadans]